LGHLYQTWWDILHLDVGKMGPKHAYTFCSSKLIQLTVLYFNILHVISHRWLSSLYFLFISIFFLITVITCRKWDISPMYTLCSMSTPFTIVFDQSAFQENAVSKATTDILFLCVRARARVFARVCVPSYHLSPGYRGKDRRGWMSEVSFGQQWWEIWDQYFSPRNHLNHVRWDNEWIIHAFTYFYTVICQRIARQRLDKHPAIWARNNRTNV
jgi:hypothetical protein